MRVGVPKSIRARAGRNRPPLGRGRLPCPALRSGAGEQDCRWWPICWPRPSGPAWRWALVGSKSCALRTESLLRQHVAQGWLDRLRSGPDNPFDRLRPKLVRSGPVQQIVRLGRDIDLAALALVRAWPDETGPSITAALAVAGDSGVRHVNPVRLVLVDTSLSENRLGEGDSPISPSAAHLRGTVPFCSRTPQNWDSPLPQNRDSPRRFSEGSTPGGGPAVGRGRRQRRRLDRAGRAGPRSAARDCRWHRFWVAIRPGASPPPLRWPARWGAADWMAIEWLAAVCGAAVEVVKCRTHSLEVPAEADLVIEGFVDPAATGSRDGGRDNAGPYYRRAVEAPLLSVETITERSGCLLPIVVGGARGGESAVIAKAAERLMLPVVKAAIAELVDYSLPGGRRAVCLSGHSQNHAAGCPAGGQRLLGRAGRGGGEICGRRRRGGRRTRSGRSLATRRGECRSEPRRCSCARGRRQRPITPSTCRRSGIRSASTPRENCRASGPSPRPICSLPAREVAEMVERRWQEYGLAAKMK